MEKLTFFKNRKEIVLNNYNAAKKFGIHEMCMQIGEQYHIDNAAKTWDERTEEEKINFYNDFACFGVETTEKRNDPACIHLKNGLKINPVEKTVSFWAESMFTPEPCFKCPDVVLQILEKNGYKLYESTSVLEQ